MRRQLLASSLLCVLATAGCASAQAGRAPVPTPTTTSTPSVAGPTLRQLGLEHGPTNLALPVGTVLESSVDQPNVVTVFFRRPTPAEALPVLRENLRAAGFSITNDAGGSLVVEGPEWTGGYTSSEGFNALTLRRRS